MVFIGEGENSRGAFPANLSELDADVREFVSGSSPSLETPKALVRHRGASSVEKGEE